MAQNPTNCLKKKTTKKTRGIKTYFKMFQWIINAKEIFKAKVKWKQEFRMMSKSPESDLVLKPKLMNLTFTHQDLPRTPEQ